MIFGLATGLALMASALSRRPLLMLLDREFKYPGFLWMGVALQLLMSLPGATAVLSLMPLPGLAPIGGLLYVASLWLLVAFSLLNMQVLGVRVIGIGLLLNTTVIALNGGRMPVQASPLVASGIPDEWLPFRETGVWSDHSLMSEHTLAAVLGDWIHVSMPFGHQMLLSPGDLVIVAGILLFFMVIPEARYSETSTQIRERVNSMMARIS